MGIAVIILGLFIVLLVVVIYKLGRIIKKKDNQIKAIKADIEKQGEDKELSQSKVTKISDQDWSEEDERNLKGIIDEIEANKNDAPDYDLATYDRFLFWLKSLKQRMQ